MRLSRRELLEKAYALGGITIASSFAPSVLLHAWSQQEVRARTPTPINEIGPFYKKRSPETSTLRAASDPGLPLAVSGLVYSERGNVVRDATIEVWQADHLGHYDLEGYRYRAKLRPDAAGKYAFDTIMPGHYPDRVCQHIHYLVQAPGHKPLITQLYFATDPAFEGDPRKNFSRDPVIHTAELIRPVTLVGDPSAIHAAVTFELVLAKA